MGVLDIYDNHFLTKILADIQVLIEYIQESSIQQFHLCFQYSCKALFHSKEAYISSKNGLS